MNSGNEFVITIPVTIASFMITILTTGIAVYMLCHFFIPSKKGIEESDSKGNSKFKKNKLKQLDTIKISKYFKLTASATLVFSALNALFNTLFCLYFIWDPMYDDSLYYVNHVSHMQRITSTICWYIAKVSLIWFFSGRLYYTFKGSVYRVNRRSMVGINAFNTIFGVVSIFVAYWYTYHSNRLLAELSFNLWRFQYQILVLIMLYMFSKRLLLLNVEQQSTSDKQNQMQHSAVNDRLGFLMIITRHAVITFTLSVTSFLVIFCWFGLRWLFGKKTRLTLLIPMMMATFDSLITSICIVCLFHIGNKLYYILFILCDKRCYHLSMKISSRLNINVNTLKIMNRCSSTSNALSTSTLTSPKQNQLQCDVVNKDTVITVELQDVEEKDRKRTITFKIKINNLKV